MKHEFYERDDGLLHCRICGGAEGSLTTECPGMKMMPEEEDEVYAGTRDFKNGMWYVEDSCLDLDSSCGP